jgi:hypothetical protein
LKNKVELNSGFRIFRIWQVVFVVVGIVTTAYSTYLPKAGDIIYVTGPGYAFNHQRIDYVFSQGVIIPISKGDSINSIIDTGLIGAKIDSNWGILKGRRKIGGSSFLVDAGGVTLHKNGEAISLSNADKFDSISTEALTSIKISAKRVDSIFRNGDGKRFLDSSRIIGFEKRLKSTQSRIDSKMDSGSAVYQSMIHLYNGLCSNLTKARTTSMSEYGTTFGASYECKEHQLSINEELTGEQ